MPDLRTSSTEQDDDSSCFYRKPASACAVNNIWNIKVVHPVRRFNNGNLNTRIYVLQLTDKIKMIEIYFGPMLPFFFKHSIKNPPKVFGSTVELDYKVLEGT